MIEIIHNELKVVGENDNIPSLLMRNKSKHFQQGQLTDTTSLIPIPLSIPGHIITDTDYLSPRSNRSDFE